MREVSDLLLATEVEMQRVQVALVRLSVRIELVPALNDGVVQILEDLVALLVARRCSHTEMRLEHAALDRVGQCEACIPVFVIVICMRELRGTLQGGVVCVFVLFAWATACGFADVVCLCL
jgi:hypothetical protein